VSVVSVCCRYPDTYVRNKAVDQLRQLPPDDLYDLLPQLVQVRHQGHGQGCGIGQGRGRGHGHGL